MIAGTASDRLDPAVFREVGSVVGSYLAETARVPFSAALLDALAEPVDASQVLNTAVAFGNAVALTTLVVARDEQAAADVVRQTLRLAAPSGGNPGAEALILRLLVPVAEEDMPTEIGAGLLLSLAEYGDAAVRLTDSLDIPRGTLAAAVSAAAAHA